VNPTREELNADFAAIRGALICITGDLQKVTVKMRYVGVGLPAGGGEVTILKIEKAARIVAAASCSKLENKLIST
jgi:hypothetical protein